MCSANFLIDSDGHKIDHPRFLKNSLNNVSVEQKIFNAVGWGQLLLLLSYKCQQDGKTLHKINHYEPSSKVCSCCGYKMDKMPLSVREWECPFY
jgi:putative transposase